MQGALGKTRHSRPGIAKQHAPGAVAIQYLVDARFHARGGVDAVWQLLGFFCNWAGGLGSGRALGCGEIEFFGQIRPHDGVVRYEIDIVRYQELPTSGSSIALGDAKVLVDDQEIYEIKRAKVGVFRDIDYPDYPWPSRHSRGGRLAE